MKTPPLFRPDGARRVVFERPPTAPSPVLFSAARVEGGRRPSPTCRSVSENRPPPHVPFFSYKPSPTSPRFCPAARHPTSKGVPVPVSFPRLSSHTIPRTVTPCEPPRRGTTRGAPSDCTPFLPRYPAQIFPTYRLQRTLFCTPRFHPKHAIPRAAAAHVERGKLPTAHVSFRLREPPATARAVLFP